MNSTLWTENKVGRLTLLNLKIYSNPTVIKTEWGWRKNGPVLSRIKESSETDPHDHSQLTLDKEMKSVLQW